MLVLVINLDRAPERLAHMRSEFARIGVEFTRLAATDGRDLDLTRSVDALEGRHLSKGEVACFMSHRRCWQHLLDSGESHAIVLEDDMFLGEGAERFFAAADWIPDGAGLVKLETYRSRTTIEAEPAADFAGRSMHRLVGKHLGAGAYVLDREAAELLIASSATIDRQVDDFMFDPDGGTFGDARVYQMVPALCIQGLKLDGKASAYASQLYEERLTTRTKPTPIGKIRREIVSGVTKGWLAARGKARNLFGATRWGRIPFR